MKDLRYSKWLLSLFIIMITITISFSSFYYNFFVYADNLNPGVYSKDSKPFGISYGEWLAKWVQWFIQIPSEVHPREHYTPERCATGQSGPVWFLVDILKGKEERTCTIPTGKAILLPVLSGSCWDDNTDPSIKTEEGLTKCSKAGNEYGLISATLDGKTLKGLDRYRAQSPFFEIKVPQDNVFNNVPGVWKAKVDGFFVFLEPLPPGEHTLQIKTSVANPFQPNYNYGAVLTYHLVVKP
jgi:hypothetical protein